jgi:ATP-binding cassette subfamily F protein uup
LLVSHDRTFLNNVVASTIVFEEDGVREYVGGYDDWLRQRSQAAAARDAAVETSSARRRQDAARRGKAKPSPVTPEMRPDRRLTYKEQQELAALPDRIEQLETEIAELHEAMAAPEFYKRAGEEIARDHTNLRELETQLAEAYRRWEELEERCR